MPELPEVETIRLGLQKYLIGHRIERVEVRLAKMISGDPKNIIGAKVIDVKRFGKGLVINLDNGYCLAIHVKLTGQLIYQGPNTKNVKLSLKVGGPLPNKRTHVIFKLSKCHSERSEESRDPSPDGRRDQDDKERAYLYYNDFRQFGWIRIVKSEKLKDQSFFKDLGPEPFKDLTFEKFKLIVEKGKLPIKILLMDQKRIGGIGNIYANDALFEARINPKKRANDLSQNEIKNLYNAILRVLKLGLDSRGASELNFVDALGQDGQYQNHFLAYAQDGKPCTRCKTIMKKITLGGRGTYFCPSCQK